MEREAGYRAHQEWLGYVQPVGLVVSPAALFAAQVFPNRNVAPAHARFLEWVEDVPVPGGGKAPALGDLAGFVQDVLGWRASDLAGPDGTEPIPDSLTVALTEYGEVLRPTFALRAPESASPEAARWLMLIDVAPTGHDLDAPAAAERSFHASLAARFERLLRETRVEIGLLANGTELRLLYVPRNETSGSITFPVRAMAEPAGRIIFAALHMLLHEERLFGLGDPRQRLPHILAESRRYQGEVSVALSQQVLGALNELLRGFQAAHDRSGGELLRDALEAEPNHVYAGLLTTLLRLVFVLYAEERGLFPGNEVYVRNYSVSGLFERLRGDADRFPDTMDRRYGAWARCLALFRLIHDGGGHGAFRLPRRHGALFNPDRFPFLEGRPYGSARNLGERIQPPRVPDGVIYRVLRDLLLLDGERISYRALDVEQIGSVYEAIMGFNLRVAAGRSIAVRPEKSGGAPEVVDLDELLATPSAERVKALRGKTKELAPPPLGAADPARRGRDASRQPPGRPALPLRRRQEPARGRPGQAVVVADHARPRPRVHVRRPRAEGR